MTEPGCENNGSRNTLVSRLRDQRGNGRRRRCDDQQIGNACEIIERSQHAMSVDVLVARIDERKVTLELSGFEISKDSLPQRSFTRTCAGERDRARGQ